MTQPNKDLKKLQEELTVLALRIGDATGVKLDYSLDSVKHVDAILEPIHQEYLKDKNMDGLNGVALEMAAYIVTVIEKNLAQGTWERDSAELGSETFPYTFRGQTIFPYQWCMKRIIVGSAEDTWPKFQSLVLDKVDNSPT